MTPAKKSTVRIDNDRRQLADGLGRPFMVRGMIFEGFLHPISHVKKCIEEGFDTPSYFCRRHLETRDYFFGTDRFNNDMPEHFPRGQFRTANGTDALSVGIRDWNINTVRFNINQEELARAPGSRGYNAQYVEEIKALVKHARARNLIVFLALFDYRNQNAPEQLWPLNPKTPIDSEATLKAAVNLSKINGIGNDKGVVLELLNEPYPPATKEKSWQLWIHGGKMTYSKSPWYGMNFPGVNLIIKKCARRALRM